MSKQTKGGNGNVLLLAGLGIGAFMLLANKSKAGTNASFPEMASGSGDDIPDAPKILAVNSSSTESPLPTGVVSDEAGMEATGSDSTSYQTAPYQSSTPNASSPTYNYDDDDEMPTGGSPAKTVANAALSVIKNAQAVTGKNTGKVPPLLSTKLTQKETGIINAGKLTASLALKRPDLYKAAFVKKLGGNTMAGKKKALNAATLAISAAVNAAQAAKTGGLTKAVKYPAKAAHTFVQTAGGMASQTAIAKVAALQKKTGVKVSPAAQKVAATVKAAKAAKAKPAVKKSKPVTAKPAKKKALPAKAKAARPAKKPATKKRR